MSVVSTFQKLSIAQSVELVIFLFIIFSIIFFLMNLIFKYYFKSDDEKIIDDLSRLNTSLSRKCDLLRFENSSLKSKNKSLFEANQKLILDKDDLIVRLEKFQNSKLRKGSLF